MTRLFDLESYTKLCSYALLYNEKIDNLLPHKDNSYFTYKTFLDKNDKQGYLADFNYSQALTLSKDYIPVTHLGIDVSEDNQRLYIVPDRIDLLTLQRGLKLGERHLYKSVYHYWNNLAQFSTNMLIKPVVFIDLNSITDEQPALLKFERHSNSSYLIPILNNREKINQSLKLELKFRDSYDRICDEISQSILANNFSVLKGNEITVQHLASYLKRIKIFQLLHSHIGQNNFSIIVEILDRGNIYYKSVCLNINSLEEIVCNQIDLDSIEQLANEYKKFSFIVISDYNIFPKVRECLNSDNLLVLDLTNPQFAEIWRQKQKENFPLFGQYLDKIDFQVGNKKWITVLSPDESKNIYYEGQAETTKFIGRIQETGQDYFTLPYPTTTLPIRINDKDYCINGIAQEYLIKHPLEKLQAESEKLRVRIEFLLKPGSAPELRVRDENNKFQIETKLCDPQEEKIFHNCIPLREILGKRERESNIIPDLEKSSEVINTLEQIDRVEYYINQEGNYFRRIQVIKEHIGVAYTQLHRSDRNCDLLLNINPDRPSLERLRGTLSDSVFALIKIVLNYLETSQGSSHPQVKGNIKYFIVFLGKTYKFSQYLSVERFFNESTLNLWHNKFGKDVGEYFKFLSRVATKKEFQVFYFKNLFDKKYVGRSLYQTDSYLWGYGRILAWYSEFQYTNEEFEYLKHFKCILEHLLNQKESVSEEYKRNAFLSLIYLLTFRELDKSFCADGSEELELAKRVLNSYHNSSIILKRISKNKSLNEYFGELLSGNSSTHAMRQLLPVD